MRRNLSLILVGLSLLALAGCETAQERDIRLAREQAAEDAAHTARCESFGAKKGTPAFVQCRQSLYIQARDEKLRQEEMQADLARRTARFCGLRHFSPRYDPLCD